MEEKEYITPPRYSRNSSTPQSDRGGNGTRLFASESPLGTRSAGGSPLDSSLRGGRGSLGGSPFGTSSQRPSPRQRSSFQGLTQRSSPLGGLNDLDGFGSSLLGGSTGTPTKSSGTTTTTPVGKASVGLNSKWLYEKGRGSPRSGGGGGGGGGSGSSSSGFAGFGGGGSVFT